MRSLRRLTAVPIALLIGSLGCSREEAGEAQQAAEAQVQTREIDYQYGDEPLQGFIAWDAAMAEKRPGVLVVHEWWGHNQHARNQARRLAEAGYVGFALDMYGKGKLATHPEDAQAMAMEATRDPAVTAGRFNAALERLKQDPHVDPERIAAIGYCFGGAVVLTFARAGADLDAVASVHGGMPEPAAVDSGAVKARILVLTGGADPLVPPERVAAFADEMRAAGVDIEVISYPGVRHSFTNPEAGQLGIDALAYDAEADRRSWAAILEMLEEVFR
ncbi:MAG: dienelactone hydrolase family protein [Gemmatimonadota bacterium]|nr:MAG: dienelactone hydrolase family protein [Gemmatimonadota bacterium]